jgi:hypothetical protein
LGIFLSPVAKVIDLPKRLPVNQRKETKVCQIEVGGGEPHASLALALAEMAASNGVSTTDLVSSYRSGLAAHGQVVEDRIEKEFSVWLIEFVKAVANDVSRTQAWETVKTHRDIFLILNDLYLFTYPEESEHGTKRTAADALKDSCRFLKEKLDKLIPRYGTLHEATAGVFADPKLKLLGVMSGDLGKMLGEPVALLKTAERELKVLRDWAEKQGSNKTYANDFYLYKIAERIRQSTGEYHYEELTTLTEAALAAHGGADQEALDRKTLERRVQRFITRNNLRHERTHKKHQ